MEKFIWHKLWVIAGSAVVLTACSSTPSAKSTPSEADRARAICAQPAQIASLSASVALATGYFALQDANTNCAEAALNQARRLDPKNPYVALNLGVVYQKTGRAAQARAAYQEVIDLDRGTVSDPAVAASNPASVNSTPGLIARRNLTNLK